LTCHSFLKTCVLIFVSKKQWGITVCVNSCHHQGLAFVKDPDGYWIEILNPAVSGALAAWKDE